MSRETCPRSGYVYVLTNSAMPGIVKVGRTTRDVPTRVTELFQTGVPVPFDVVGSVYSPDCHVLEARAHAALGRHRVDAGREFFRCKPEIALEVVTDQHQLHMEEIVTEYLPGCCPVPEDDFIDTSVLREVADAIGVSFETVCLSLFDMEQDDFRRAVERHEERMSRPGVIRAIRGVSNV